MFTFVFEAPVELVEVDVDVGLASEGSGTSTGSSTGADYCVVGTSNKTGPHGTASTHAVQVMPREYDEFVSYIEGKRCLDTLVRGD